MTRGPGRPGGGGGWGDEGGGGRDGGGEGGEEGRGTRARGRTHDDSSQRASPGVMRQKHSLRKKHSGVVLVAASVGSRRLQSLLLPY